MNPLPHWGKGVGVGVESIGPLLCFIFVSRFGLPAREAFATMLN